MTPRSYWPVERQRTVDAGRERILAAAGELLSQGNYGFSLDAVARKAGVTRMTVYNQFGSKAGVLEELFDQLVTRGAFSEMPRVLAEPDLGKAFDALVEIFGRFYTENRSAMLKMRAAAGADPDLDKAIRSRNERRRMTIEKLLQERTLENAPAVAKGELVIALDTLLNFSTFDAVAGPSRSPDEVVPVIRGLVRATLGLPAPGRARRPSSRRGKGRPDGV